jgi:hypothetical protein
MFLKEFPPATSVKPGMKLKLFIYYNTLDNVEKEINEWLELQQIRVCYITQSQGEKQGKFVFVISVFYESPDGRQAHARH